ncbi:hypothetical protein IGI04_028180, partial [Brassica rapa subsp. trilocularis]
MVSRLSNEKPIVYETKEHHVLLLDFQLHHIRNIKDPERPSSLEHLKVLTKDSVEVDDDKSYVRVTFTPTMKLCGITTLIGLCVRVKLMRNLPGRYKVDIRVAPGTHATEAA